MRGDPEIGDKDNTKNEKAQISAKKKIAHTERALKNDVFFIKIHKTNWIAMIFCCNPFFVVIGDL